MCVKNQATTSELIVTSNRADTGRLIGKGGCRVIAMRALVLAMASKDGVPVDFVLMSQDEGDRDKASRFRPVGHLKQETVQNLFEDIGNAVFERCEASATFEGHYVRVTMRVPTTENEKRFRISGRSASLVDEMRTALDVLGYAISIPNRKSFTIQIIPELDSEMQPESAAGRFAR
jgi:predicted RNA-binding protein YlqC (UPF0109 family)